MNDFYDKPEVVVEENVVEEKIKAEIPPAEELRMQEDDLLRGLLDAADFKESEDNYKTIRIKRGEGEDAKLYFEFDIRPLSEDEIAECRKAASKKYPHPSGRKYGQIEGETNVTEMRSRKILKATIPGDNGKKIWENVELMRKLDLITAIDVIDKVLLAGEKSKICDIIDTISGYDADEEDFLKN